MRADMGKVLVERPRLGRRRAERWPGKGYRKGLKKCFEAGDCPPEREGMKRSYGFGTKSFNEHLSPLRRFLDSNVGRPWAKVYSEICRHVDRGNVVQKHILTHLFDYVVTNVILINGEPCRGTAYARQYGEPVRTSARYHQWYVCPKSGLLRKSRHVPRKRKLPWPEPPRTVKLNNKQVCVERNGSWELISVALIAHPRPLDVPAYDVILQRHIDDRKRSEANVAETHGLNRYAVSRRALSRKELLALPIPIEWLP
jgi:hypothetical protein